MPLKGIVKKYLNANVAAGIVYTSSNKEVVTVNQTTGEVTIYEASITTIKATYKENLTNTVVEASY